MTLDKAALESLVDIWGTLEDIATAVVFVGGVGESICDLTKWVKPESLKHRLERIFAIMLLVGLGGELTTQHMFAAYNGELVAVIDREAADAGERAQRAANKAAELGVTVEKLPDFVAQKEAEINTQLSDLDTFLKGERIRDDALVVELTKDKDALTKAHDDALAAAKQAEESLARIRAENEPRLISDDAKKDFVAAMKPFSGLKVEVWTLSSGTSDSVPLANTVSSLFMDAQWTHGQSNMLGNATLKGILIMIGSNPTPSVKAAGDALVAFFKDAKMECALDTTDPLTFPGAASVGVLIPNPDIDVIIGSK